jgi:hypothetical protein
MTRASIRRYACPATTVPPSTDTRRSGRSGYAIQEDSEYQKHATHIVAPATREFLSSWEQDRSRLGVMVGWLLSVSAAHDLGGGLRPISPSTRIRRAPIGGIAPTGRY